MYYIHFKATYPKTRVPNIVKFFNPAIMTGMFSQSRNPDGFYRRLITILVIFSYVITSARQKRSLKFRSRFLHRRPSRPSRNSRPRH